MPETVAQILASRSEKTSSRKSDLEKAVGKLRKIDRLLDRLTTAARPESDSEGWGDWELIFNAIFSSDPHDIKLRTHAALDLAGASFPDYYDPDTTYEADARAWIEAFKEILEKLEARLRRDDDED